MIVQIKRQRVDVARRDCATRECLRIGEDKGTFCQGRGYTSYHRDSKGRLAPRIVCLTRHLNGCPCNSVCPEPECRTASVLQPGEKCERCGGLLIERASEGHA